MSKPIYVGTFVLGRTPVNLLLDQSLCGSGSFNMAPDGKATAEIRISLADGMERDLMCTLMHEALEFCYALQGCRYAACSSMNNGNSSDWLFVADHQMFDRAVYDATTFMLEAAPNIKAALKKVKG